jgi:hypothetical protein
MSTTGSPAALALGNVAATVTELLRAAQLENYSNTHPPVVAKADHGENAEHTTPRVEAERRLTVGAIPKAVQRWICEDVVPHRAIRQEGMGRNFDVSLDGSRFLLVSNLGSLPDPKASSC